eukprot:CAMPEP_0206242158 /NCGR_PEP_ID=MMETSP0047_2-20121206/16902_1 /ASSEMBLY_ACC=CAM_ASM_000192 /TAXON_ID=195065 /ORGANISM="Chroomonas mesostigmatica_cf, Strain CCMP1168" /LENGTH=212 /DNA_ID=CAMNT_0053667147 /DNA_START=23 /DNA_END=658 /DNA_ORIENTATION=+
MSSVDPSKKVAVQQVQRKTWDVEEYQRKADEKAKEREEEEQQADEASKKTFSGAVIQRESLKRRDADLQIEKMVGRSMVVSNSAPLAQQGGYYCKVCDCTVKDSMSWLDHVNGKKHNRNLGMSMRVERATIEEVKDKMKSYKPSDRKANPPSSQDPERAAMDELDARIDRLREEEEREKEEKRSAKRQKKDEEEAKAKEGLDDGFADMMGFG